MSKPHAHRIIQSTEIAAVVPIGTESVARELAPLKSDAEALRETWAEVVELHGDTRGTRPRFLRNSQGGAQIYETRTKGLAPSPAPVVSSCGGVCWTRAGPDMRAVAPRRRSRSSGVRSIHHAHRGYRRDLVDLPRHSTSGYHSGSTHFSTGRSVIGRPYRVNAVRTVLRSWPKRSAVARIVSFSASYTRCTSSQYCRRSWRFTPHRYPRSRF